MAGVMQVHKVEKWRGRQQVLTGINFDVLPGEMVSIIGHNGAGKSTLLNIMAGLLRPDAGVVRLSGHNLEEATPALRTHLGVALRPHGLSPRLTVQEILQFFSLCYAGNRSLDDLLHGFSLTSKRHSQLRLLSLGEQQRVSLALAFLKPFKVLLLDEPLANLDPEGKEAVWAEIRRMRAQETAVICATHLLEEAQQWSDFILILQAGQSLAYDSPEKLLTSLAGREKVTIRPAQSVSLDTLQRLPGVTRVMLQGPTVTLYCDHARTVLPHLMERYSVKSLTYGAVSLEDVMHCLNAERKATCVLS